MNVLDEAYQAGRVAALWKSQYGRHFDADAALSFNGKAARDTHGALVALDGKGTARQIADIIGNDSWCCPTKCSECGTASWVVVEIGEEPDYESATARVCLDCLRNAVALLEAAK